VIVADLSLRNPSNLSYLILFQLKTGIPSLKPSNYAINYAINSAL
jgi:hypothetical protein